MMHTLSPQVPVRLRVRFRLRFRLRLRVDCMNCDRSSISSGSSLCCACLCPLSSCAYGFYTAPSTSTSTSASTPTLTSPSIAIGYSHCVFLFAASAWIELLGEPAYLIALRFDAQPTRRLAIDAVGVCARCIVTIIVLLMHPIATMEQSSAKSDRPMLSYELLCFAYGQVAYSLCFMAGHLLSILWSPSSASGSGSHSVALRDCLPGRLPLSFTRSKNHSITSSLFDDSLMSDSFSLCIQSIYRFALSEGEKLILTAYTSATSAPQLRAQGIYALVSNLGSIVARIVLQPIEEATLIEFSAVYASIGALKSDVDAAHESVASDSNVAKSKFDQVRSLDQRRQTPAHAPSREIDSNAIYWSAARSLSNVIQCVICFGLVSSGVRQRILVASHSLTVRREMVGQ